MKVIATQKGKEKQKRVSQYHLTRCIGVTLFDMEMIADQFGDEWPKYIMHLFVGHRIEALFGNG